MKIEARIAKIVIIGFSLLIASFLIISYSSWYQKYKNKIYPNTHIGNLDLSEKTYDQAQKVINDRLKSIGNSGIKFQYNNKVAILTTDVASFDSDLSRPTLLFESEIISGFLNNSLRNQSFFSYLLNIFNNKKQITLPVFYKLDDVSVKSFLKDNFSELNIEAKNAFFSVSDKPGNQDLLKIVPETPGKEINYEQAINEIKNNLNNLENVSITIKTQSKYPSVKQENLKDISSEAEKFINRSGLTLTIPTEQGTTTIKNWSITPKKLITWLSISNAEDKKIISFDTEKIKEFLKNYISAQIDVEPSLPRFEIINGKVSSWQKGKNGKKLDLDLNASLINNQYLSGQNEVQLVITDIPAEENTADNLQIKEIIGTGHSAYTGSPANRQHNIKTGAAALHGLLIKPGEEFSLLKVIGDVTDKTGYLPELVIKGNKTIPEFGGGLCQIGTTVFRTALSAGLPITMRQNHSYRVSYYEPAGTDATIYIPSPDFRFINDTPNYILIQARVGKNDLYFDFWGTKDGRIASSTYPTIYNIVEPEPAKIIESNDLKPGEKKCTEKSHNGADAYFDYKVIYPINTPSNTSSQEIIKDRRFKSHYVPWRAVCLIGKQASSSPLNNSSTIPTINTNTSSLLNTSTKSNSSSESTKTTGTPAVNKFKL